MSIVLRAVQKCFTASFDISWKLRHDNNDYELSQNQKKDSTILHNTPSRRILTTRKDQNDFEHFQGAR